MMMPPPRLNHLNLCTRDVRRVTALLVQHFAFEPEDESDSYAILHGADAFLVVVTRIEDSYPSDYPHDFHLGFQLESHEAVHRMHRELLDAGLAPLDLKSFTALAARWTAFYLPIGDGARIEVNARMALDAAIPAPASPITKDRDR